MPGRPRKDVIREDAVGVYHVWSRCVRRSWLCGYDPVTRKDFSYRKQWIYARLQELVQIFAVDACVYAILSNHYHLIVRNRIDLAADWSDQEVVRRWWQLYPERRDEHGGPAEPTELEIRSLLADCERVSILRKRLSSISWFMKCLNEWISVRANREDQVTGHFFQERFGCRNLLDESAILACAVYIDLNEIRAQLAETPEESRNTSAYCRILARLKRREREAAAGAGREQNYQADDPDYWLCPIDERDRSPLLGPPGVESSLAGDRASSSSLNGSDNSATVHKSWRHGFLPVTVDEYLEFLDWNARQVLLGREAMADSKPPILTRLGMEPSFWIKMIENFDRWFHGAAGSASHLMEQAARTGRQWLKGVGPMRSAFS